MGYRLWVGLDRKLKGAMAGKLVARREVSEFVERCMKSIGAPYEHAASLADILVTADYRGHFSHGLNRLGKL